MKNNRQSMILDIIAKEHIETQEQLLEQLVVRSSLPQKMQRTGQQEARKWFWFVWRPLRKTLPV